MDTAPAVERALPRRHLGGLSVYASSSIARTHQHLCLSFPFSFSPCCLLSTREHTVSLCVPHTCVTLKKVLARWWNWPFLLKCWDWQKTSTSWCRAGCWVKAQHKHRQTSRQTHRHIHMQHNISEVWGMQFSQNLRKAAVSLLSNTHPVVVSEVNQVLHQRLVPATSAKGQKRVKHGESQHCEARRQKGGGARGG